MAEDMMDIDPAEIEQHVSEVLHTCRERLEERRWLMIEAHRHLIISNKLYDEDTLTVFSWLELIGMGFSEDSAAAIKTVFPSVTAGSTHLVTAKQAITMPCPRIAERDSARSSIRESVAARPYTFAALKELPDATARLAALRSSLDDRERRHIPVSIDGDEFEAAADVREVRGPLSAIAPLVNRVAAGRGVEAKLCGGGSGRGSSCSDWIVMTVTSNDNSNSSTVSAQAGDASAAAGEHNPSSRVLACVEAKGNWQVQLVPGEKLWLADQQRLDCLRPALQQLYGDMVQEEVQWGLLTTINASLLVKRDACVENKTLYLSPVYSHKQLLLVLLYLIEQAAIAAPSKQQLRRHEVLLTPPVGYSYVCTLPVPKQLLASDRQQRAKQQNLEVPSTRAAKRQRHIHSDLEAATAINDSVDTTLGEVGTKPAYTPGDSDNTNNGSNSSSMLKSMFPHLLQLHVTPSQLTPTVKAAPSSECLEVELLMLDFSQVRLMGQLADGSHGKVLRGELQGKEVVLKIFDRHYSGWEAAFKKELSAYALASALQDDVLCKVEHSGMFGHTGALFLALSPAGKAIDNTTATSASVQDGMRTALRKLHEAGILHGDVWLSSFCIADDGRVKVVNLDRACACGLVEDAEAAKLEEQQELEVLFEQASLAAATAATV